MLEQLVAALGLDLGLTGEEIADVLWLATHLQNEPTTLEALSAEFEQESQITPESPAVERSKDDESKAAIEAEELDTEICSDGIENPPVDVYAGKTEEKSGNSTIALPDARSLREPLQLARELKPLLRRVTVENNGGLDEEATIQRITEEQIWMPVLKPTLEPWLDLVLVVDESPSMVIWQRTVLEYKRILERYGVFRNVSTWGLGIDEEENIRLYRGIRYLRRQQRNHSPRELIDPNGRRLILLVSDCIADYWRNGQLLEMLQLWTATGPMAVTQMLPQWLWNRTALGQVAAAQFLALEPGVSNQQLITKPLSRRKKLNLDTAIRIPVVTLEQESFSAWAEMLSGKGGVWSAGVLYDASANIKAQKAKVGTATKGKISAAERVQHFRLTTSPMGRRLAGLLASAPVITFPIVRILQDRLLPESRQVHVAEVFLGGLLETQRPLEINLDSSQIQFDFMPGVRSELLESVPKSQKINVFNEVSVFISQKLGISIDEFSANVKKYIDSQDTFSNSWSSPFARVAGEILNSLGEDLNTIDSELKDEAGKKDVPASKDDLKAFRVFISCGNQGRDLRLSRLFSKSFFENKNSVFLSGFNDTFDNTWESNPAEAIETCDYFICLVSSDSLTSGILINDVKRVLNRRQREQGCPAIVTIYLGEDISFGNPASRSRSEWHHLSVNSSKLLHWKSPKDNNAIVNQILKLLQNGDSLADNVRVAKGKNSQKADLPKFLDKDKLDGFLQLYAARSEIEHICQKELLRAGAFIWIDAPQERGKTSLIFKLAQKQLEYNHKAVVISFKETSLTLRRNYSFMLNWFCSQVTIRLGLADKTMKAWNMALTGTDNTINYFERYLLRRIKSPVLICLDDIDVLSDYPETLRVLISSVSSWSRYAKIDPLWKNIKLIFSSTQSFSKFEKHVTEEPLRVLLPNLNESQISELISIWGLSASFHKPNFFTEILDGIPNLTQMALSYFKEDNLTIKEFREISFNLEDLFGESLIPMLFELNKDFTLASSLRKICMSDKPIKVESETALKLERMGLTKRDGELSLPACKIYKEYFASNL